MKHYNDKELLKAWEIIRNLKTEYPKDIDQATYNNILLLLNDMIIKNKLRTN